MSGKHVNGSEDSRQQKFRRNFTEQGKSLQDRYGMEQAKHTPGAERAAREIGFAAHMIVQIAEIISRETHDAEMLEALKQADYRLTYLLTLQQTKLQEYETTRQIISEVRAAIAKAEGRQ